MPAHLPLPVGVGFARVANSQPALAPEMTCAHNLHGSCDPWFSLAISAGLEDDLGFPGGYEDV